MSLIFHAQSLLKVVDDGFEKVWGKPHQFVNNWHFGCKQSKPWQTKNHGTLYHLIISFFPVFFSFRFPWVWTAILLGIWKNPPTILKARGFEAWIWWALHLVACRGPPSDGCFGGDFCWCGFLAVASLFVFSGCLKMDSDQVGEYHLGCHCCCCCCWVVAKHFCWTPKARQRFSVLEQESFIHMAHASGDWFWFTQNWD